MGDTETDQISPAINDDATAKGAGMGAVWRGREINHS